MSEQEHDPFDGVVVSGGAGDGASFDVGHLAEMDEALTRPCPHIDGMAGTVTDESADPDRVDMLMRSED